MRAFLKTREGLCAGQRKGKCTSLSFFRNKPDLSSMRFHNVLDQVQPQAGTLRVHAAGVACTEKPFKDASLLLIRDSYARILNRHLNVPIGVLRNLHFYCRCGALPGVLYRVADEVLHSKLEFFLVGKHRGEGIRGLDQDNLELLAP